MGSFGVSHYRSACFSADETECQTPRMASYVLVESYVSTQDAIATNLLTNPVRPLIRQCR